MPRRPLNRAQTLEATVRRLGFEGPTSSKNLREALGISHATLARLIKELNGQVTTLGKGRATTYAAPRNTPHLPHEITLFEITEGGGSRTLGQLHLVRPQGYFVVPNSADLDGGAVPDLPHYLFDLRPSGFLGRLIPRLHPDLDLPDDIRVWSGDTTLHYLMRRGWNQIGSLILGEKALQEHLLESARAPSDGVQESERGLIYPLKAGDMLSLGVPGSSAAGEQPKFLATVMPARKAVLVKFSPPLEDALSRRIGDLLVAEHLALKTLRDFGQAAARSELLIAGNRVFLEIERFDRTAQGGRRGLLSLLALDSQFVANLGTWGQSVVALAKLGVVPKSTVETTLWLEAFSQLIANTDRHFGNLSFFARGARITGLAPAYDVSPMLYAPVANQLVARDFAPPPPEPRLGPIYSQVCQAALTFWQRVSEDTRVSPQFREISAQNQGIPKAMAKLTIRLPKGKL